MQSVLGSITLSARPSKFYVQQSHLSANFGCLLFSDLVLGCPGPATGSTRMPGVWLSLRNDQVEQKSIPGTEYYDSLPAFALLFLEYVTGLFSTMACDGR